jgi:ketosteroid isomerase-like protein
MSSTWRQPLVVAFIAALTVAAPAAQDRRGWSDQQILIQLERDWDAAFLKNDVAFVEGVLADEFVATYDDGSRGDKARELKLVAEFNQKVTSSRLDEFTVKVYGDTAVVWFTRYLAGPSKGRLLEVSFRYIDVFVQRNGKWLCVASQSTKHSEKYSELPK